jgi:filamentous hemagglutinin
VVVTYFTAGAGAFLSAGITNAALQAATQAALQAIVTQTALSVATAAITGNKLQLDVNSLAASAVTSGVLAYTTQAAGELLSIKDALRDDNFQTIDYFKNAAFKGAIEGVRSEVRGDSFQDGFKTGAIVSLLSDSALQMRRYVADNFEYSGKDGSVVDENKQSAGVRGDEIKLGGSSYEKTYDSDGELKGEEIVAPFGGSQTGARYVFKQPYDKGGLIDKTIEHFAGPHDFISSWNYENINGVTYLRTSNFFIEALSGVLLFPSIPFAAAPAIQDNLDFLQEYKHTLRENDKAKEEAIRRYYEISK